MSGGLGEGDGVSHHLGLPCAGHASVLCTARPCSRKGKGFAVMTRAGVSGAGKDTEYTRGKSTHRGHFPYVSYLKVINQANKPLNETCSVLLPC